MWLELCSLVESVSLSDEEDELVWQHQSSGVYSSHSLYSIINFRVCYLSIYLLFGKLGFLPGFIFSLVVVS
jgi:hypothetical protein